MHGLPWWLSDKECAFNTGDMALVPRLRRLPGGKHVNLFQYSCLETPMDRGAYWAAVYSVAKSLTRLSN